MNADGSRPVNMQVNLAATLPWLPWVAAGLLIGGIIFLVGGILLIVIPVRRASWHRQMPPQVHDETHGCAATDIQRNVGVWHVGVDRAACSPLRQPAENGVSSGGEKDVRDSRAHVPPG